MRKQLSVGGILMIKKAISLSKQLESFRNVLEPSAIEYMKMNVSAKAPSLLNSKLGGMPYLPLGITHPRDDKAQHMLLLAQVNFSEGSFPFPFPRKGLLQFFISPSAYEQTIKTKGFLTPKHFQVRYFHTITTEELVTDLTYLQHVQAQAFPIKEELPLSFVKEIEPVSATDYRLTHFVSPILMEQFTKNEHQLFHEIYLQYFSGADMKTGGYPYFIGEDFRGNNPSLQIYDTLLLQIVSNDDIDIMWGDCGVLKFFINHDKLQKLDFSEVLLFTEDY